MTDDSRIVKRYRFVPDTFDSLARMQSDPEGEWIRFDALPVPSPSGDVDAARAQVAALIPNDTPAWEVRRALDWYAAAIRAESAGTLDLRDCECVPGHRCDCQDLRSLLYRILTNAEYQKMEAEGLAADALGLTWDEATDRYARLSSSDTDR